MAIVDKIQGGIEKLTNDDTRLNTAEITSVQQAFNNLQLGLAKIELYLTQTENNEVREMLTGLRDEFVKPNLERPKRILDKAGLPSMDLAVEQRVQNMPKQVPKLLRDEEILLDTVYSMQATITGLQTGALIAIRGDVRDFFLNARDAAFDQWRAIGKVAFKTAPNLLPPTMSGVR